MVDKEVKKEDKVEDKKMTDNSQDFTKVVKSPLLRKKNTFTRGRGRRTRPKPEFQQKIINISRVTRVVKGGRRLSFRVDMVIGDKQGKVGVGSGKAGDTSIAIEKSYNNAKKNMIKVGLTENKSIPYEVKAKYCASRVEIRPNKGRGLVVGSTVRNVLELAGITDVTAKILSRSENKLNNAKAAFKAIGEFQVPYDPKKEKEKKEKEKEHPNSSNERVKKDDKLKRTIKKAPAKK